MDTRADTDADSFRATGSSVHNSVMLTLARGSTYHVDVNTPESPELRTERLGAGVVKRPTTLADGRELIYYDDPETTLGAERSVDARTLAPRPDTATMRLDVLTGDWITVAANRQNRVMMPGADADPLAPQTPGNPSEVPSRYDVAVFENRSPRSAPLSPSPSAPSRGDEPRAASTTSRPSDSGAPAPPSAAARSCASAPSTPAPSAPRPLPAPAP